MNAMKQFRRIAMVAAGVLVTASISQAVPVIFDDFNTNEGHFTTDPLNTAGVPNSGTTNGFAHPSSASRIMENPLEGAGAQQIMLTDDATPGGSARLRHLSGGAA